MLSLFSLALLTPSLAAYADAGYGYGGGYGTPAGFTVADGFEIMEACPNLSAGFLEETFGITGHQGQMVLSDSKLYIIYTSYGRVETQLHVRDLETCTQRLLNDEIVGGLGLAAKDGLLYVSVSHNEVEGISTYDLSGRLVEHAWVSEFEDAIEYLNFDEAGNLYASTQGFLLQISADKVITEYAYGIRAPLEACVASQDTEGVAKELYAGDRAGGEDDVDELNQITFGDFLGYGLANTLLEGDEPGEEDEAIPAVRSFTDAPAPAGLACSQEVWNILADEDLLAAHPVFLSFYNAMRIDMYFGGNMGETVEGVVAWGETGLKGYDVIEVGENTLIFDVGSHLYTLRPKVAHRDDFILEGEYAVTCQITTPIYVPALNEECKRTRIGALLAYGPDYLRQQLPFSVEKFRKYSPFCDYSRNKRYLPVVKYEARGFSSGLWNFYRPRFWFLPNCQLRGVELNVGTFGPSGSDDLIVDASSISLNSNLCYHSRLRDGKAKLLYVTQNIQSNTGNRRNDRLVEDILDLASPIEFGVLRVQSKDKFSFTVLDGATYQCQGERMQLQDAHDDWNFLEHIAKDDWWGQEHKWGKRDHWKDEWKKPRKSRDSWKKQHKW